MKKIYIVFAAALALLASCQEPQYVEPTVERQGITSLTAYFTSGQYVDQAISKLTVTDPEAVRYVIPIPWYYPEESDEMTTFYMTSLRVRAELAPNCKIEPPLTILNLTKENHFTYTNAQGESRDIIITGERVRSDKCTALTFALTSPYYVEGFVNDELNEIYLFTKDDLNGYTAEATPCAHAKVKTKLSTKKNYNEEQELTIVADDGVTERTYRIIKREPTKIPYGFREKSVRQLFHLDPITRMNFPPYDTPIVPSLGYVGGSLVVCLGDGTEPVYIDGLTGVRKGKINLGSAPAAAVTSDEGGNLLLTNHAGSKETVEIYRTKSVTEAPVLFHSFVNDTDVPVGYNIKVHGNIDTDAVIILTHEGVAGVTTTSKYTRIVVSGGQVAETLMVDLSGNGYGWGPAPTFAAKIVPVSAKAENGVMLCYYTPYVNNPADTRNTIKYINGNGVTAATHSLIEGDASSNYNSNVMDAKTYNNATYAAHLVSSYFPKWSCGPQLRVFDITSPTSIKDGKPVLTNTELELFQMGGQVENYSAADVIIAPSADGFKVFIYYFDHHSHVIGGYVADCINI